MAAELQENNIEWYTGDDMVTLSFSQKKYVNKIMKHFDNPDIQVIAENIDGSICARIPLSWIKISPPRKGREFTDEERAAAAERLKVARESRQKIK